MEKQDEDEISDTDSQAEVGYGDDYYDGADIEDDYMSSVIDDEDMD